MAIWEQFQNIIKTYPGYSDKTFLVAVSGGLDSMVLLDLVRRMGLKTVVAHCNFQLRGKDSEEDMALVEEFCKRHDIPFYGRVCPVGKSENVQLEARRLRYAYFDELMKKIPADFLLTAHHADDQIETFFINLMRGSGIQGLTGIKETEKIKRPLLAFTRHQLEEYARTRQLSWREDRSNFSTDYLRNSIRHRLIPLLNEIRPAASRNIYKTIRLLQGSARVENEWFEEWKRQAVEQKGNEEILHIDRLPGENLTPLFLHKWIYPLGFKDLPALLHLLEAQTGKKVENDEWIIVKYGNKLILSPQSEKTGALRLNNIPEKIRVPLPLKFQFYEAKKIPWEEITGASSTTVFIDADKFQPPFEIRPWRPGDRMQPLGMEGTKKISDILTDAKVPLHKKNGIYLLTSQNMPVWLIGYRLDERFKITPETGRILKIEVEKN